MIKPVQLLRLMQINFIIMRYTINRSVLTKRSPWLRFLSYFNPLSFLKQKSSRGESIRIALESLGPIFIKFGQVLSTRQDLIPEDIAAELAKLQDQVPPFSSERAVAMIEEAYEDKILSVFKNFDKKPLASASIAQVHAATLHDGNEVIVKVLRPNIKKTIRNDLALMHLAASFTETLWKHGRRLRPVELVAEFEQTILDEMNMLREAANASQLRRNFKTSDILYVPKIFWEYTKPNLLVMERIQGVPISNIDILKAYHTNMKVLAERGVTIFFTQVFRDSFFHADMHPGNLFIDITDPENPRYLGVDFGIMGTLSPDDQHYLAENLLAFFNRDYRRIAVLHVESGWVPPHTRIDQFESTIRTLCEPIFERPLCDISFGLLLMQLFQAAERYEMKIQPQLMLLQKTLLYIEGMGRQLYPELDLWTTAKPFMEQWARTQYGLKSIAKEAIQNWQSTAEYLLKTPRLVYESLHHFNTQQRTQTQEANKLSDSSPQKTGKHAFFFGAGIAVVLGTSISLLTQHSTLAHTSQWQWGTLIAGGSLLLIAGLIRR